MKNNIYLIFIFLVINIFSITKILANEQFDFNVTEIEINDKGNIIRGLKRGTITTRDGIVLDANTFEYNKTTNVVIAKDNVIIKDIINNLRIESNNIVYEKNNEKR